MAAKKPSPKKSPAAGASQPAGPVNFEALNASEEGKRLIALATDLRTLAIKLQLPLSTTIGGVAVFGSELQSTIQAAGMEEGRRVERELIMSRLRALLVGN